MWTETLVILSSISVQLFLSYQGNPNLFKRNILLKSVLMSFTYPNGVKKGEIEEIP